MNSNSNNSSSSTTSSSSRPSTTQACAACKYQRRKCNPDCILAPYFPADHQHQFLNAHRLFGVSNILKIIRGLDPQRRSTAMKSIIFQSNMRTHDPVGGCYRIILDLERQYDHDCQELAIVLHQLALCRQAAASHVQPADPSSQLPPNLETDAAATNEDGMHENKFMIAAATHQQQQQQYYDYFYFDGSGSNGGENNIENDHKININNAAAISSHSVNNNNNNNNVDINGNANEVDIEVSQSMFSLHHHEEQEEHEDDVKPLIDMFDVKPLIDMFAVTHALAIGDEEEVGKITSKSADHDLAAGSYHLSTEIQAKREEANPMEHVQEHDLKGAASLFTLTSRDCSYV